MSRFIPEFLIRDSILIVQSSQILIRQYFGKPAPWMARASNPVWRARDSASVEHTLNPRGVIGADCAKERSDCTIRDNSRVGLKRLLECPK